MRKKLKKQYLDIMKTIVSNTLAEDWWQGVWDYNYSELDKKEFESFAIEFLDKEKEKNERI